MKRELDNAILFGVCSGVGKHFKIDPVFLRLALVLLTLAGFGMPILAYLVAALLMDAE